MNMARDDLAISNTPPDKMLISSHLENLEDNSISKIKQLFMNLNENKKISILLNFLVSFILIHEILISHWNQ